MGVVLESSGKLCPSDIPLPLWTHSLVKATMIQVRGRVLESLREGTKVNTI